ncbi:MAG: hypothetical protein EPO20_14835 [Betaproteobacteria bacterium]|nr:MAG: hypothetical protein EPO20_14835 [Betaproteobacteria bacterium]
MSANPTLISTVRNPAIRIQNADGTAFKTLGVAPVAAGTRVKALHITSDDTAAQTLQVCVTIGGVDHVLGEIAVAAGAGTDGATNAVNGLAGTRMPGLQSDGIAKFIDLATGSDLKFKSKVAVTAGKTIYIFSEVGDFT